jgi:Ca2+-binding EF-hand superfamily protein
LHIQVGGKPFRTAFDEFLNRAFAYVDRDGNGELSKAEVERAPNAQAFASYLRGQILNFGSTQATLARLDDVDRLPKDGKVTRAELADYYRRGGAAPFSSSGVVGGQVFVNEIVYAGGQQGNVADELTGNLYKHLDGNKDDKLAQEELAQAPAALRRVDADEDEAVTVEELAPARFGPQVFFASVAFAQGANNNPNVVAIAPGQPVTAMTQALLGRCDANRDQKLSAKEAALTPQEFASLDANRDGQLDQAELGKWTGLPVDLELTARFGAPARPGLSIFQPLQELSEKLAKDKLLELTRKSDAVVKGVPRKESGGVTLKLDASLVELRRQASGNAPGVRQFYQQQFKTIDKDGNGFLEKKEVDQPDGQFLQGVFAVGDGDGDGKLTDKEFKAFLDLLAEAGAAHYQLSVTDQGQSLLELLDANNDRRLGLREWRTAWVRLAEWDRDGDKRLAKAEVPRRFQVSLGQGQLNYPYQTFSYGMSGSSPGKTAGPLWFRKMDGNRDGDVSRREFVGEDEDFARLDADGDGLISKEEAERAAALLDGKAKR